jgi:hypothetical protein
MARHGSARQGSVWTKEESENEEFRFESECAAEPGQAGHGWARRGQAWVRMDNERREPMTGKLFFGGVPTGMDVAKLMELELSPGVDISYEKVTEIIGEKAGTSRFRTVTNAWRKRLFRERLLQSSAEGGAFHFLTADAAHDKGRKGIVHVGRISSRLRRDVEAVDLMALTGERQAKHHLLRREIEAVNQTIHNSAKALALPTPVAGSSLRLAK